MSLPFHRGQVNNSSSSSTSSANSKSFSNMTYRPGGGSGNYFGSRDHRIDEANRSLLEQENDRKWEELGNQVSMLKSLTIDINNEVKSQNSFLDGMGSSMGSATNMFKSTISKLGIMLNSSSSTHMYILIAFVVFVFLVIYFMMNK